jgi:murein DD-endopeptidase MepM/ murein hydrolase activator NlpD
MLRVFPVDMMGYPKFSDAFGSHRGTDIFALTGTPVLAVDSGTIRAADDPKGGTVAYLKSTDGTVYYYAHLTEYVGNYPRSVSPGEVIGTVGTSGNAKGTAPHLHFEIHTTDKGTIDPYPELLAVAPSSSEKLPIPYAPIPETLDGKKKRAQQALGLGLSSWFLASHLSRRSSGLSDAVMRDKL